uniref:Uncharacterized protein n=1 Tax=Leersia perrieri TaxID=77586 RepID=A0A0D9WLR2_9ORYZ
MSLSSSLVRVLAVSHVHPAVAGESPPPPHAVELTFLDSFHVSKAPIQRLFFFDGDDLPPFESIVCSLQSSLAATLAVFFPLAGKLAYLPDSGDVVIDHSPEAVSHGVKFVEAEYDGAADDMRRLAADEEHDAVAFVRLVPELDVSRLPAPLLAVQVTRPRDGGGAVAVGVAIHHGVADGQSVWQFIKAWGHGPCRPRFSSATVRHGEEAEEANLLPQRRRDPISEASNNRGSQSRRLAGDGDNRVSTYIAVTSLAWTSIVRAKSGAAADDDIYFMVSADFRRRLRPPADEGYFGNCIGIAIARSTAGEICQLAGAAAAIRMAIREEVEVEEAVAGVDRWRERRAAISKGRLTEAGSSHRYMAYETDFRWGPPSRVELVTVYGDQLVTLLGVGGGGVQGD